MAGKLCLDINRFRQITRQTETDMACITPVFQTFTVKQTRNFVPLVARLHFPLRKPPGRMRVRRERPRSYVVKRAGVTCTAIRLISVPMLTAMYSRAVISASSRLTAVTTCSSSAIRTR